jgi:DNA-binding NtrC family response regulator
MKRASSPNFTGLMTKTRILLIEDDARQAASLARLLQTEGYEVVPVHRGDEGLRRAREETFGLIITDLRMPGLDGLHVLQQLHQAKPRLPIVLMTAFATMNDIIEATKHGAFEYLRKPFKMDEFLAVTAKAIASSRLMAEPVALEKSPAEGDAMVGSSRVMEAVYKEIGLVAATTVPVLIRGETGTGKELVARAIYQHSLRAERPFIALNCAAIPETLLESELFGHERGAFTGAENRHTGRFERAHEGTLFLDEIGDMSAVTQTKLLRVLQEGVIQRVGGRQDIPVDVRMIAATHRDLDTAIRNGQFREDLYYRLAGTVISLPPLRERGDQDIGQLVKYYMARFGAELGNTAPAIEPAALSLLQRQPWPGNVRQLSNVIRQALLRAGNLPIGAHHIEALLEGAANLMVPAHSSFNATVEELLRAARRGESQDVHSKVVEAAEFVLYSRVLELSEGNQAKAARWLGVARQTVRDKWQHFSLRLPATGAEGPEPPESNTD